MKYFIPLLLMIINLELYSQNFHPDILIFKIKGDFEYLCTGDKINHHEINTIINNIGGNQIKQKFKYSKNNLGYNEVLRKEFIDLRFIYEVKYNSSIPITKIVNKLMRTGVVEYAEPLGINHLTYTPNDYSSSIQDFISIIDAPAAWNTQKGDTNIVIAITDTGTDWDHPDLKDNIKYNYNDPIDNIDNDGDGYVDNYRGWDLGENDNDPMVQGSNHGAHVSGCAAASTDNNTGVASPGFNCKFLPVKIADAQGNLIAGYEGIVYAADQGCQIINCSWGSNFGGQLGQDIINYASVNNNALVVAGAGNDNSEEEFFPASYDNVLSVGASTSMDGKASFSNYGYTLDICAPGVNIYSTNYNNTYSANSGTSMSSPIAAGCAAIVQSQFPNYTGIQIGEVLRVSADNIENKLSSTHKGKMGTGRVNLYNAVNNNSPSIRVIKEEITDNNNNTFMIGESIEVTPHFTNYLQTAQNVNAVLSCNSSYINITSGVIQLGTMNTFDTIIPSSTPFSFDILSGIALNQKVQFKITIATGGYTFEEYFDVVVNVDFINVLVNSLNTTITSRGMIGYNENNQTQGYGVEFSGESLLFDAGLMITTSGSQVSDNVRGMDPSLTDEDFVSMINVYEIDSGISDLDTRGKFNDNAAGSNKLSVICNHYSYAWATPPYDQFVILKYVIYNGSGVSMDNIHAGIFADWDIMDYSTNRAEWDNDLNLGYAFSTETQGLYGGIQLLSPYTPHYYAISNDGSNGSMNIYDGFTEQEKYTSISNQLTNNSAGPTDVSMSVGSGSFSLEHGDSVQLCFALHAAHNLNELKASAQSARNLYDSLFYDASAKVNTNIEDEIKVYPNLFRDEIFITNTDKINQIKLFNLNGKIVYNFSKQTNNNKHIILANEMPSGIYFIELISKNGFRYIQKLIKQ